MSAEIVDRATGEVISYGQARDSVDEVNRLGARCFDLMLWYGSVGAAVASGELGLS